MMYIYILKRVRIDTVPVWTLKTGEITAPFVIFSDWVHYYILFIKVRNYNLSLNKILSTIFF